MWLLAPMKRKATKPYSVNSYSWKYYKKNSKMSTMWKNSKDDEGKWNIILCNKRCPQRCQRQSKDHYQVYLAGLNDSCIKWSCQALWWNKEDDQRRF